MRNNNIYMYINKGKPLNLNTSIVFALWRTDRYFLFLRLLLLINLKWSTLQLCNKYMYRFDDLD